MPSKKYYKWIAEGNETVVINNPDLIPGYLQYLVSLDDPTFEQKIKGLQRLIEWKLKIQKENEDAVSEIFGEVG